MTLKEMFKKIESYNEVAELMNAPAAAIYFYHKESHTGEEFTRFEALRKFVRQVFIKETADRVLNHNGWEFDKEYSFNFTDDFGYEFTSTFTAELVQG